MSHYIGDAATFFWVVAPARAARRWAALGQVMSDGRYLMRWPVAAALIPLVAFAAGFAIGGFRPRSDEIFTIAIAWPVVLLAFGALGAGVGLYAWVGFVIGDFFVFPHISWETELASHLLKERLPLLILYEVLLGISVLLPIAAASLPASLTRRWETRARPTLAKVGVHLVLADVVAAMVATSWVASLPLLIRPLATFHGTVLGPQALQPLRDDAALFVAVAVAVTTCRVAAEAFSRRDEATVEVEPPAGGRTAPWQRRAVKTAVLSLVVALGLSGLLDSPYDWRQDVLLFGAVFGSAVLRTFVLPAIPVWGDIVGSIPVLLRIVGIGLLGGFIGQLVLSATSLQGSLQTSFTPILVSIAIGMLVTAVVIPNPGTRRKDPTT